MNILHSLPREDGFHMPAEFEPHEGCFLIWPERPDSWAGGAYAARKAFVKVISAIARWEKVTVFASYNQYENARASLPPQVRVAELSTDDAWARDVSPVIVKNAAGEIRGIDWGFNAWGGLYDGLYFPWDRDNHVARKACDLLDIDCYDRRDFILEGGSIHADGEGTVMVTEECLLSPGRNPDLSGRKKSSGSPTASGGTRQTAMWTTSAPSPHPARWCWPGPTTSGTRSMSGVRRT